MTLVMETELPLKLLYRGKVRDTYDLGNSLLFIATDRISAFDFVLPSGIPEKGLVLNQMSAFWFNKTRHILPNHLVNLVDSADKLKLYSSLAGSLPSYLIGRSMIVKKAKRLPIEAVVRGFIAGTAWEEYKTCGTISGIAQPKGLKESQKLPRLVFTPTTKAESGHDLPLSNEELTNLLGKETSSLVEEKSIAIFEYALRYASEKGIIVADSKFEFGFVDDSLTLIDELLTPDSSRFWDAENYQAGKSQPSFDKQPVRDWLIASSWDKKPPAPTLPDEIIQKTSERYKTAFQMLTGTSIYNPNFS
jgi:phosphoribosylaminoimidazole-succinocarboxamide synthase